MLGKLGKLGQRFGQLLEGMMLFTLAFIQMRRQGFQLADGFLL